ncbi:ABC transporter permease [Paenibacillus monticola]|uniref:FtsX-like permease family protein n=1 Tax=Paenibacillus monticola TaxID=2666075 RepID=A0A7X2L214_9BACL|nr:FtsX-like permease family protein [Paenibacillus monticola]
MRISDISKLAWGQIKRRKVVTGLCMVGISIGCAAIIVALSIGDSAQSYSEREMNSRLKMDEITVTPNSGVSVRGGGAKASKTGENINTGKLTRQKLEIIKGLKHVTAAAPFQELGYAQMLTIDNKVNDIQIVGTDLDLLTQYGNTFKQGGPSDQPGTIILSYGATLGLMDLEMQKTLFEQLNSDPYNTKLMEQFNSLNGLSAAMYQQQIELQAEDFNSETSRTYRSSTFRVVGVLNKPKGTSDEMIQSDKKVYVSLETAVRLTEELHLNVGTVGEEGIFNTVTVKVDKTENLTKVEGLVKRLTLNASTNLFQKKELEKTFAMLKRVALGIGVFILIIASISIIVAMTMSTHQRRRQIGIMKVLGANMGQIRNMFITESALLGLLGGMVGIGFSYLIVSGINKLVGGSIGGAEMGGSLVILIPLSTIPVGIIFAILTGVLSGIYPAISASRINALTAIKRD